MKLNGNIYYEEALIVDKDLLSELEVVLIEYFEKVSYNVTLINGDSIEFDSLDELFKYENVKSRKITVLEIEFGFLNRLKFDKSGGTFSSYKYSLTGYYTIDDDDKAVLFTSKLKLVLDKGKRPKWYTFLTKFSAGYIAVLSIVLWIILILMQMILQINTSDSYITANHLNIALFIIIIVCIIIFICSKIRDYFFPVISYMIGQQKKEIEKLQNFYEKFFWGIIITLAIGIITAILF